MNTGPRPALAWTDWEGQSVAGEFPLLRFLGGSERSAVFLTERAGEPGKAAIKVFPAGAASADGLLARWGRAAQLSHPHLLRLFETGYDELNGVGFAYVVMQHAEETLAQVDRALTEKEARDLLGGAVSVLTHLRERGLAHGHLQPSNILANDDRLLLSSDSIRPCGEWRGELETAGPYSAPEAARDGATPAGDVWSLGVTLVEALTRRMPSPGSPPILPPEALPRVLGEPISRCLRPDPRQRATDGDLAYFLRVSAVAPSRIAARSQSRARLRWYVAAAAAAGLALAGVLFVPPFRNESSVANAPDGELAPEPLAAPPVAELPAAQKSQVPPQPEGPPPESPQPERPQPERPQPEPPPEPRAQSQPATQPQRPAPAKIAPVAKAKQPSAAATKAEPKAIAVQEPSSRTRPEIIHQVLPEVPAQARDTIQGKVSIRIRLFVDSSGSVVDASNQSPNASRYFGDLALQAARQWQFAAADANAPHSSAWTLVFEFRRDAKRPVSVQATASLR